MKIGYKVLNPELTNKDILFLNKFVATEKTKESPNYIGIIIEINKGFARVQFRDYSSNYNISILELTN